MRRTCCILFVIALSTCLSHSVVAGSGESLPSGAVLHLSFDEPTVEMAAGKTTVRDLSGHGNHGVVVGAGFVEGVSGQCLRFDGNKDIVTCGADGSLDLTDAYTISAWVRTDTPGRHSRIVDRYLHADKRGYAMFFHQGSVGAHHFRPNRPRPYYIRGGADLADGRWHHCAVVANSAGAAVYVDGEIVTSRMNGATPAKPIAKTLTVGNGSDGSNWFPFHGDIDEVLVFNRSLSAAEIGQLSGMAAPLRTAEWVEPDWQIDATKPVTLRFNLTPGERLTYTRSSEGQILNVRQRKSFPMRLTRTDEWMVREPPQPGRMLVRVIRLDGSLRMGDKNSEPPGLKQGQFTMLPTGRMLDAWGVDGILSLPTFPPSPVRIGGKWSSRFSLPIPANTVTLEGDATYTLTGLAQVDGRQLARIEFQGMGMLDRVEISRKAIGVAMAEGEAAWAEGAPVGMVVPGSPADAAGVQAGDRIVMLGDRTVGNWEDLVHAVRACPDDTPSTLTLIRDEERVEIHITPKAGPSYQFEGDCAIRGTVVFDIIDGKVLRTEVDSVVFNFTVINDQGEHPMTQTQRGLVELLEIAKEQDGSNRDEVESW